MIPTNYLTECDAPISIMLTAKFILHRSSLFYEFEDWKSGRQARYGTAIREPFQLHSFSKHSFSDVWSIIAKTIDSLICILHSAKTHTHLISLPTMKLILSLVLLRFIHHALAGPNKDSALTAFQYDVKHPDGRLDTHLSEQFQMTKEKYAKFMENPPRGVWREFLAGHERGPTIIHIPASASGGSDDEAEQVFRDAFSSMEEHPSA